MIPVAIIEGIARLLGDIQAGKIGGSGDAARKLVGLGLDLVPVEELRNYLTEEDMQRAERIADTLEHEKFGNEP
ncbi:MAG: hypothetical protein FWD73_06410 [Polyangiaceae bacterium]|nr:hypothetical protein [Polyangiaceae bacterium]